MDAEKKGIKHGKMTRAAKLISIVLILSMILGNILAVNAETSYEDTVQPQGEISDTFKPSDPLEFMQDPAVVPGIPTSLTERPIDPEHPELFEEEPVDIARQDSAPDNGTTDKYIVKYKAGKNDSFKTKMKTKVANGKALGQNKDNSLTNNKDNGNKNGNAYTNNGKGNGSGTNKKSTLETNDWEILTLTEKMLPSEFAAEVKASQADTDIEYIQPDYTLSLQADDAGE